MRCNIISQPGGGTSVKFIVPLGTPAGLPADKEPNKGNYIA